MPSPIDQELVALFDKLKQRQPVEVARQQVDDIYPKIHQAGEAEAEALRLSSGLYKRLQDEIRPVLIYAAKQIPGGEVQFHLSDGAIDATAWLDPKSSGFPIEVTIAHGKVRHHQMRELNEKGMGHGFTDATDADTKDQIKKQYDDYRGYAPEEAAKNIEKGIDHCVRNKAHLDSILVIAAPFESMRPDDWPPLMPQIARRLPASKCKSIFVVGKSLEKELCFQLK